ncbi:MAG: hypothetical protein HY078_11385 [Elusimicrobia bacterium]|nr:hypothetical protein [Elusimicrobiota bacterium]
MNKYAFAVLMFAAGFGHAQTAEEVWVEQAPMRALMKKVIDHDDFKVMPMMGAQGYYELKRTVPDSNGGRAVDFVTVWGNRGVDGFGITEVQLGSERWSVVGPDRVYVDNWTFELSPNGEKRGFGHNFMVQADGGRVDEIGGLFPRRDGRVDLEGARAEARAKLAQLIEFWNK